MTLFVAIALTAVPGAPHDARAQEGDDGPPRIDPAELARPGPAHRMLSSYAGTWDVTIRLGAGAAAMEHVGIARARMVVGGRFLVFEMTAASDRGPFEGMLTIGFDRRHDEYTIQSFDSWGTYFVTARGKREGDAGPIKLYGTDDDPHLEALGLGLKEFAYVLDFRDADHLGVEVRMIDTRTEERREMKMMEYTLTRSQ